MEVNIKTLEEYLKEVFLLLNDAHKVEELVTLKTLGMGAILFCLKTHIISYNELTELTEKLNEVYETRLSEIRLK